MLESMWNGLNLALDPSILLLMLLATLVGNFFGVVPGIGGQVALALLIPFCYGMEPFYGLAFLLSMHAVVHTGGAIPSILFAIPGEGPTAATILDGYPMCKQGRAGEAMGAMLAGSAVGGIVGAVVLALCIPILKPIIIYFGSPEIFALLILGMTFVVILSRESIQRGLVAALLGLLIGTIGLDPNTGVGRYTFDQLWLWDGISMISIAIGIFAFAEIIDLGALGSGGTIAQEGAKMTWSQLWKGTSAVFREWPLTLRSSLIGTFVGIIPGLGADVATWIAYGNAVQTCKNSENFGKGDIRGVIAVETTNNSKEGGALLPTIAFGIPGSGGMALLLGAFLILGVTPGPKMLTEHLDMVWGMIWVLIISNIIGAATLYPLAGYLGKLALVRVSLLLPPIMVTAAIGASVEKPQWQEMVVVCFFGLLGYGMKKWEYPRAPMILGFILGPLGEKYLLNSLNAWGMAFALRPLVIVIMVLGISSLAYSMWHAHREKSEIKPDTLPVSTEPEEKYGKILQGKTLFASLFFLLFALGLYFSLEWSAQERLYPTLIIIPGLVMSVWSFWSQLKKTDSEDKSEEPAGGIEAARKVLPENERAMILWVILFFAMLIIVGYWVTTAVFTAVYMALYGREHWRIIAIYTAGLWVLVYLLFTWGVQISLPGGILGLSW